MLKLAVTIKKPGEKHSLSSDDLAQARRFILTHAFGPEVKVNTVIIGFGATQSLAMLSRCEDLE